MNDSERDATVLGALVVVAAVWMAACGSSKSIRHYQPEVVKKSVKGRSTREAPDLTLAVENFSSGSAYDEQRMIYRTGDYRLDYYHYHRWAASPGMLVADVLRDTYRTSGAFKSVTSGYTTRADVVLSGRVLAVEEVDVSDDKWIGHVTLDLRLRDAATGELLWTRTIRKRRPLPKQSPEGLATAVSEALTAIGLQTIDTIVEHSDRAVRRRNGSPNSGTPDFSPPTSGGGTSNSGSSPSGESSPGDEGGMEGEEAGGETGP